MEKNEVRIQRAEAERPKMMPAESARRAKEMPGEIVSTVISGYLPASTLGSMDSVMANLATAANIVHDSRMLGNRLENIIKTAATRETTTAANGINEKYVSIELTNYSTTNST